MQLLGNYINGNYDVKIYSDGTKVRETINPNATEFISDFPECIDLKITNQCDMNCPYCHEDSSIDGLHADLLNNEFIDTLAPYTELALGGGNPLSHPDLGTFLARLYNKNIIANVTVNQTHFMQRYRSLNILSDLNLIKGLGISITSYDEKMVNILAEFPNAVLHVINGIMPYEELQKFFDKDLKLLILGYKDIRRGKSFYDSHVEKLKLQMYDNIKDITKAFKVTSFDNLAIEQLELKRLFNQRAWDTFYMGDDGKHTMYIDLVKREYASSSTSLVRHPLSNDIKDMFKTIIGRN
jgi:organic radical activating enzyme